MSELFVHKDSIVRKIWGSSDTVLLIFAGASAEFALNKAVDWLYYTGRLPADPIGRLFSTVSYAQDIVFASGDEAAAAIDRISAIHKGVEQSRGARIPDAAYLDVLFMLIDYSIRSFELLQRRLTEAEKAEVFSVFHRVGSRMQLNGLPEDLRSWRVMRAAYLEENLVYSDFTRDLYLQYKRHLGAWRYRILTEAQGLLAPAAVRRSMGDLTPSILSQPVVGIYKWTRMLSLDRIIKGVILPGEYKAQIRNLDMQA